MITNHHINLIRTLFSSRTDVFAVRWEKGGKSGYMPSYQFDKYSLQRHKIGGGTFQNYSEKRFKPLTDHEIERHLLGHQQIGIYPLLIDNTSWFIAADFDKENWADESRAFIVVCEKYGLQAHLERSRSGNGGHVWLFFEKPYPAYKSRKVISSLLEESGAISVFEKESSFDRLFPNQDSHSGKGLGNLIALPLFSPALEKGNSCFVDPATLTPFDNQWEYLSEIKKVEVPLLEQVYQKLNNGYLFVERVVAPSTGLVIRLSNVLALNRNGIPLKLINFLKEELNFVNNEFLVRKKLGKSTWGIERYFRFVEERNNEVTVPRGMIGKLIRFCTEQHIKFDFQDQRAKVPTIDFTSQIKLRPYQQEAVDAAMKKDFGVIVAPPGSGKTVVALHILAGRKQPSLIIVHRKQLADQWVQRIETFLGIPKKEVGSISGGKVRVGKLVTVATIQTLNKIVQSDEFTKIEKAFGTIVVDECHHVPAQTYRNTISKLHSFYLYGLTATPFRKYNDGKLIFVHLGEVVAEIKSQEITDHPRAQILVRNTNLFVPFNPKTDNLETLSKMLVHDSARNKLILDDVSSEIRNGRRGVVITERKDHIETINQFLKQTFETITLSGEDSESMKKEKWN
ncbi:MAG: DEAD/DEAH box helicase, partial [Bacteroidetes bacterium]|nr:DEAD/DEAH box helicase [Bacteroidota bacterium]